MGLAVLAGVVLLPVCGRLADMQHRLGCLRASATDAQAQVRANQGLIRALPEDEILTMRLARSELEWLPTDEMVVIDPARRPAGPPALVTVPRHPRPDRPNQRFMHIAAKLEEPAMRRSLVLLAAWGFLAGILLSPGHSQPQATGKLT
jgi:hypothetical protein